MNVNNIVLLGTRLAWHLCRRQLSRIKTLLALVALAHCWVRCGRLDRNPYIYIAPTKRPLRKLSSICSTMWPRRRVTFKQVVPISVSLALDRLSILNNNPNNVKREFSSNSILNFVQIRLAVYPAFACTWSVYLVRHIILTNSLKYASEQFFIILLIIAK